MGGLPDCGNGVWVGPPLSASAPSPGSPAFCLSVAVVNPHEVSSEKLNPFEVAVPASAQLVAPPRGSATTAPKLASVARRGTDRLAPTEGVELPTTVAYTSVR